MSTMARKGHKKGGSSAGGFFSKFKSAKSKTKNTQRIGGKMAVLQAWMKRFGIYLGLVVFVLWAGAWFILSGTAGRIVSDIRYDLLKTSTGFGYEVKNILVVGREYTDPDILLGLINTRKGDPILAFNPHEAKGLIEEISWVRSAQVERRLPDTVYIELDERKPMALWHNGSKQVILDTNGDVITDYNLNRFSGFVLLTGEGAPQAAPDFLVTLLSQNEIFERVEGADFIDNRRWDLRLKSGMNIRLPEEDIGLALSRLVKAQEELQILDQNLISIDLREKARIIVRKTPGLIEELDLQESTENPNLEKLKEKLANDKEG